MRPIRKWALNRVHNARCAIQTPHGCMQRATKYPKRLNFIKINLYRRSLSMNAMWKIKKNRFDRFDSMRAFKRTLTHTRTTHIRNERENNEKHSSEWNCFRKSMHWMSFFQCYSIVHLSLFSVSSSRSEQVAHTRNCSASHLIRDRKGNEQGER